jgi:hypothetical protein
MFIHSNFAMLMWHYVRNVPTLKGGTTICSDNEDEESNLNMIKAAQKMRTTIDKSMIHLDFRTQIPGAAPQAPTPQAPASQAFTPQVPALQAPTPQVPAPQAFTPQVPAPQVPTPPTPQAPVTQVTSNITSNKQPSSTPTPFEGTLTPLELSPAPKHANSSTDKTPSDRNTAKKPNQGIRKLKRKKY